VGFAVIGKEIKKRGIDYEGNDKNIKGDVYD